MEDDCHTTSSPQSNSNDDDDDNNPDLDLDIDLPPDFKFTCADCPKSVSDFLRLPFSTSDACYFLSHDQILCKTDAGKQLLYQTYTSVINIDAIGLRVLDYSGWIPLIGGFDLDVDIMYFSQSNELGFFASAGPQEGAGGGAGDTHGIILGWNMPNSQSYTGGSIKLIGGDLPLPMYGVSLEADASVSSTLNSDGTVPTTIYIGGGPVNLEAGQYFGVSNTWNIISVQLP
jgi:hypothetical protein